MAINTPAVTRRNWRPYIVLLIGLAAVSTSSSLIRAAQDNGAPSLAIAAWRLVTASLILTPIIWLRYRDEILRVTRTELFLAIGSGAFLALHFAAWITSLQYTSVISAVVLVDLSPLFLAMLSPLLLKERLQRNTLIGIGLALLGSVVIATVGDPGKAPIQNAVLLGDALAVLGAAAVAGYYLIGRRVRKSVGIMPYIWLTYSSAAVFLTLAALFTGQLSGIMSLPPSAYLWMTLLALLPQLIGHSAYNYALGYLSAAYIGLTNLAEPIGSAILAFILFAEQPTGWAEIGGVVLILAALVLGGQAESKKPAENTVLPEAVIEIGGDL
jgi:drug/metabolite transporter (DMT)-like permease